MPVVWQALDFHHGPNPSPTRFSLSAPQVKGLQRLFTCMAALSFTQAPYM